MAPNETSYMISYPSPIVTLWLSWIDLEIQAIENLCDLDWLFNVTQGQRQWRQMNLIYDFLSTTNSNSVVILNRFGDIGHWKLVWPRFDISRSLKVKDNGSKWNLIYDFLSITNSNSVVILNRFGDIGHWKPVWPGLTFQLRGHSRSKKTVPNETLYMTSYMWLMVTNPLSCTIFRDIGQNSVIMGVKKQIWPPCRHFWNRTENKWAYMLALLRFLSAPSLKEIQLVLFELRFQVCLHPRWERC